MEMVHFTQLVEANAKIIEAFSIYNGAEQQQLNNAKGMTQTELAKFKASGRYIFKNEMVLRKVYAELVDMFTITQELLDSWGEQSTKRTGVSHILAQPENPFEEFLAFI